ncbi:cobalt-precorrin-6A reductase [Nigerium massiliense]|uniref:cobalt-precorrin-6A reductase n=1 Tax=Nigerium massiliense TaxID=1522317 RepID=UPI00058FFD45|nr:cobalt-precorrin-6A reductase [Nigerium massiliense]
MRVLVLGGTADARRLAAELGAQGHDVTTSLAGATSAPLLPPGRVRTGGFGGVAGLVAWLRADAPDAVIDATHPFAARMSAHAADACAETGTPLARLSRPGWADRPDSAGWRWVDDHDAAARVAAGLITAPAAPTKLHGSSADLPARRAALRRGGTGRPDGVLLTVGRQSVGPYRDPLADARVYARMTDAPDAPLPPGWTLLTARGPFALDDEVALLGSHRIGVLVTKDSGGDATAAKLDAAAELGIAVVMVRRPPSPKGAAVLADVAAAAAWLSRIRRPGPPDRRP